MNPERRHSPDPEGSSEAQPERSPWGLAAVALIAGLLQIIASVALGLARLDQFTAAAGEGAYTYMVIAALIGVGVLCVWLVRARMYIALALVAVWPVAMWLGLRAYTTSLGLAYHGEFILHHFSALLCLVLGVTVPLGWARDQRLGKFRAVPAVLAIPGALLLAGAHLGGIPLGPAALASRNLAATGATLLLAAWPVAAIVFWPRLGPPQRRPLVFLLLLPLAVRLGLAGWHGLSGDLVSSANIVWVGAAIFITANLTLLTLRPRLEIWVMLVVALICLLGSVFIYYLYEHGFGELEDGLSGLLQSLFGFAVPYPSYVEPIRSAALMLGLLVTVFTVYAALVSSEDRVRGLALGLMVVAGIGFSSPHLALMFGVGALLLVETLLPGAPSRELAPPGPHWQSAGLSDHCGDGGGDGGGGDDPATGREGELEAIRAVLQGLAERIDLAAPTIADTGRGTGVISLRGELPGVTTNLDLRARVEPGATRIELSVGLPERGDPVFELVPDSGKRGKRPAHLLARSHRLHGELRALEVFGDAPLDAMTCFPTAYLRAWDGGIEVELGRELSGLRVDHLEALVRALGRALDPVPSGPTSSPAPPPEPEPEPEPTPE